MRDRDAPERPARLASHTRVLVVTWFSSVSAETALERPSNHGVRDPRSLP